MNSAFCRFVETPNQSFLDFGRSSNSPQHAGTERIHLQSGQRHPRPRRRLLSKACRSLQKPAHWYVLPEEASNTSIPLTWLGTSPSLPWGKFYRRLKGVIFPAPGHETRRP